MVCMHHILELFEKTEKWKQNVIMNDITNKIVIVRLITIVIKIIKTMLKLCYYITAFVKYPWAWERRYIN